MSNLSVSEEFIGAIAFAGDLSMGQPVEHSPRVAVLAMKLAGVMALNKCSQADVCRLALLRWAGCTANARDFSDLLGDDIRGRAELLANRNPFVAHAPPAAGLSDYMPSLANKHCQAMAEIARRAGFRVEHDSTQSSVTSLQKAIDDLFENWDGSGYPQGLSGEQIDFRAQVVAAASDLEIFHRQYGLERALTLISSRSGKIYLPALADSIVANAACWVDDITDCDILKIALDGAVLPESQTAEQGASIDVIIGLFSDYAALKQPQTISVSRIAADLCRRVAQRLGLKSESIDLVGHGAMLHRLGFVAVSNSALSSRIGDESFRLGSYWTERILSRAPSLSQQARLASMAFERLDGSGQYRNLTAPSISLEARILQVCVIYAELSSDLMTQMQPVQIRDEIKSLASAGTVDQRVVEALYSILDDQSASKANAPALAINLTAREHDVLQLVTQGMSNKEVAKSLAIAPKTVGTHLDNIYRKLKVSGRTAATMKALEYGLI
ncbi:HD domain-containing phosphohydrolase [Agarilytica rhodophyticola]|uniref:HD domain-containing phosphohydrolase n=1 Tax=Agarilytica rhodophyticola TaxID=1737490 RepID=UPI000B34184E|nr:HD domain-containing phosphohydrolase [Agarilytica rhodophyticola]